MGSGGSSSASRQTYVTGGAVKAACERVRDSALAVIQRRLGRTVPDLRLDGGKVVSAAAGILGDLASLLGDEVIEETVEWRHRPTKAVDPETGQGFAHVQYAFAAHRAVVDVDTELGLVKVVALDCVQDVGKAINPQAVLGQIQGGSAQGLGLAVMEEIQISAGKIRNPSFTDYLIPTILDIPPMRIEVLEYPDPHAPYGRARGRRAADDLLRPSHRGRHPRRHRTAAEPGAGAPGAHHRHLSSYAAVWAAVSGLAGFQLGTDPPGWTEKSNCTSFAIPRRFT